MQKSLLLVASMYGAQSAAVAAYFRRRRDDEDLGRVAFSALPNKLPPIRPKVMAASSIFEDDAARRREERRLVAARLVVADCRGLAVVRALPLAGAVVEAAAGVAAD